MHLNFQHSPSIEMRLAHEVPDTRFANSNRRGSRAVSGEIAYEHQREEVGAALQVRYRERAEHAQ